MTKIRSLFLLILVPLFTLVVSLFAVFIFAPFFSRRACDRLIVFWARTILWASGARVQVSGLENIKGLKSAILISNHLSHFDVPILYSCLPITFRMAAKAELFRIPLFGHALKAFGFFSVERESSENIKGTLRSMAERFEKGESVWMAPEGTRQDRPQIGQFKMGAFFLAIKAQQPIIPIVIYGTHTVLPKKSFFISWNEWSPEVLVEIGKPISIGPWPMDTRHEFRDHVRGQMQETFSRLQTQKSSCLPV